MSWKTGLLSIRSKRAASHFLGDEHGPGEPAEVAQDVAVQALALGPQLHGAQGRLEGLRVRHQSEYHPGASVAVQASYAPGTFAG